jgi:thaumarchaeosortase
VVTLQTGLPLSTSIEWVCAGVHSLLLYSLLIVLFFRKNTIAASYKIGYFIVGMIGTFMVNVLRVVTYVAILATQGVVVTRVFHDTYGELFFAGWIFLYISLIILIQKFQLPTKVSAKLYKIINQWKSESAKNKVLKNQST